MLQRLTNPDCTQATLSRAVRGLFQSLRICLTNYLLFLRQSTAFCSAEHRSNNGQIRCKLMRFEVITAGDTGTFSRDRTAHCTWCRLNTPAWCLCHVCRVALISRFTEQIFPANKGLTLTATTVTEARSLKLRNFIWSWNKSSALALYEYNIWHYLLSEV